MTRTSRSLIHRSVDAMLVVVVILVGIVALINIGGPLLGYRTLLIRGSSMEPAVPLGSLALAATNRPSDDVRPGDIVSFTASNGVVVTHRVVALATILRVVASREAGRGPGPD